MILIPIFLIISLVTFILYGIDKRRAVKGAWRIPERVLLFFSLLGGGIGGALGMRIFRHKTKHWYFVFLNVVGVIIQIAAVVLLCKFGDEIARFFEFRAL